MGPPNQTSNKTSDQTSEEHRALSRRFCEERWSKVDLMTLSGYGHGESIDFLHGYGKVFGSVWYLQKCVDHHTFILLCYTARWFSHSIFPIWCLDRGLHWEEVRVNFATFASCSLLDLMSCSMSFTAKRPVVCGRQRILVRHCIFVIGRPES